MTIIDPSRERDDIPPREKPITEEEAVDILKEKGFTFSKTKPRQSFDMFDVLIVILCAVASVLILSTINFLQFEYFLIAYVVLTVSLVFMFVYGGACVVWIIRKIKK